MNQTNSLIELKAAVFDLLAQQEAHRNAIAQLQEKQNGLLKQIAEAVQQQEAAAKAESFPVANYGKTEVK